MPHELPVPPELEQLIEKRETGDRRKGDRRRRGQDRRKLDLGPAGRGRTSAAEDGQQEPATEQRSGAERRNQHDRRRAARRTDDQDPPPDMLDRLQASVPGPAGAEDSVEDPAEQ
jgi:hypothetical protein